MVRFFYSNKQPAQKHKPLLNTDILIVMYYFPFEQHVKKFKELERKKTKLVLVITQLKRYGSANSDSIK